MALNCVVAGALLASIVAFAGAQPPRRPRAVMIPMEEGGGTRIRSLVVSPATIGFLATDPDVGSVGEPHATVTWRLQGGNTSRNWALLVQANASSLSGCSGVPASAITVACSSVTSTKGTGVCAGPLPLSMQPHPVASGSQADGTPSYTVTITFTLADRWRYIASQSPCTLTLIYIVDAP